MRTVTTSWVNGSSRVSSETGDKGRTAVKSSVAASPVWRSCTWSWPFGWMQVMIPVPQHQRFADEQFIWTWRQRTGTLTRTSVGGQNFPTDAWLPRNFPQHGQGGLRSYFRLVWWGGRDPLKFRPIWRECPYALPVNVVSGVEVPGTTLRPATERLANWTRRFGFLPDQFSLGAAGGAAGSKGGNRAPSTVRKPLRWQKRPVRSAQIPDPSTGRRGSVRRCNGTERPCARCGPSASAMDRFRILLSPDADSELMNNYHKAPTGRFSDFSYPLGLKQMQNKNVDII